MADEIRLGLELISTSDSPEDYHVFSFIKLSEVSLLTQYKPYYLFRVSGKKIFPHIVSEMIKSFK